MGRRRRITLAGPRIRKQAIEQRIFRGEARKSMVDRVIDAMRDWRLSPFEFEGATRAGIRSALVLDRHSWQAADTEAILLIREALHVMGAKRPSYGEGQLVYTLARDTCANCLGPLDEEDIGAHRRFCCEECRRAVRLRDRELVTYLDSFTRNAGYYAAFKEGLPESACEWCGARYKMVHLKQRFCSRSCSNAERAGDRLVKPKPCKQCGKAFVGDRVEAQFCSTKCSARYRVENMPERHCDVCKAIFRPRSRNARLCSPACVNLAKVTYNRIKREEQRKAMASAFVCEPIREAA